MTVGLVTGAGAGIGRAVALKLAETGHDVGVVDRDEAAAAETAELVRSIGRRALAITADASRGDEVEAFVERTERELGPVDAFLANAGISGKHAPIWEYDEETFDKVWAINTRGVYHGIKHVGRPRRTRIRNVTRKHIRINQPQVRQPHRFHRARGGTDVSRVRGVRQHHRNLTKRIKIRGFGRCFAHTFGCFLRLIAFIAHPLFPHFRSLLHASDAKYGCKSRTRRR